MNRTNAFTLVELAIVIVIIGLLVGGVLQGQELIKQAKVRNDIKRLIGAQTAFITFYGKYNFLPGDYPAQLAASNFNSGGGNGDSRFTWPTSSADTTADAQYVWIHLTFSKIMRVSTFEGKPFINDVVHTNVYARFDEAKGSRDGIIYAMTGDLYQADLQIGIPSLGNSLTISTRHINRPHYAALSAERVWSIDDKIDDGKPLTGKLKGANGYNLDEEVVLCNDGTNYFYDGTADTCRMIYELGI